MSIQTKSWARDRVILPNVMEYSTNARVGDSAFTAVTNANNAIPSQFTTYIDPQIIDVLTAPLKAA